MSHVTADYDVAPNVRQPTQQWWHVAWRCLFRVCLTLLVVYLAIVVCLVFFVSVTPEHDDFADHLIIPVDIEVVLPLPQDKFTNEMSERVRHGNPGMILQDGLQPGIYHLYAWANPGEPGEVYVRAYEVTKEARLSEPYLSQRTTNTAQWSASQDEQFRYSAETMIYEGDWGYPYAARFELWFKPATGEPERKLVERVFQIEGWMR